ncbi:unnamed protein product [marine sediment metagenome]|uniref:Uncharacterized protein n=1 Tax=marine sediment metagenome TaxID=412755 RepID=X1D7X0_9ZZZZ
MTAISGQKTVAAAGTAEAIGTGMCMADLMIKALIGNTGYIYVGNDGAGDVSSANGQVLSAGDYIVLEQVAMFDHIYLDSSVNGEGVSWLLLNI